MNRLRTGTLLVVLVCLCAAPAQAKDDDSETLRTGLLTAYRSQELIHRAWTIVSGDADVEGVHMEVFLEGHRAAMLMRGGSGEVPQEVLGVTDGLVLLPMTGMADVDAHVLPGAVALNERRPKWVAASAFLSALYGYDLKPQSPWHTIVDLHVQPAVEGDEDQRPDLTFGLSARTSTEVEPVWLGVKYFEGKRVRRDEALGLVVLEWSDVRVLLRPEDGMPHTITRGVGGKDGEKPSVLAPTQPATTPAAWRELIDRKCASRRPQTSGRLDAPMYGIEFGLLLAQVVHADPDLPKRPNRLQTVLQVLLGTLLGGEDVETAMEQAARDFPREANAAAERLQALGAPLFETAWEGFHAMERPPLDDTGIETLRRLVWDAVHARVRQAIAIRLQMAEAKSD